MAPQQQKGIFVTTLVADKVKGFNNLELRDAEVPQPKNGHVRHWPDALIQSIDWWDLYDLQRPSGP